MVTNPDRADAHSHNAIARAKNHRVVVAVRFKPSLVDAIDAYASEHMPWRHGARTSIVVQAVEEWLARREGAA